MYKFRIVSESFFKSSSYSYIALWCLGSRILKRSFVSIFIAFLNSSLYLSSDKSSSTTSLNTSFVSFAVLNVYLIPSLFILNSPSSKFNPVFIYFTSTQPKKCIFFSSTLIIAISGGPCCKLSCFSTAIFSLEY